MKILLLGASGILGSQLQNIDPVMICPSHHDCDITNTKYLRKYIEFHEPDVIINCVAIKNVEQRKSLAIKTNIIGNANIAMLCNEYGIRLVYISTDYVYKGDKGNYKETDEVLPFNSYAWSKLGGETSTMLVENHLIIRTSFGESKFDYEKAFEDKTTSKDYVDVIAPLIYKASIGNIKGILNIGTESKTMYDYAVKRNIEVLPIKLSDSEHDSPKDTSLNLDRLIEWQESCKPHTQCRVCNNVGLLKYLDLGMMPLANNLQLTKKESLEQERYPLELMYCNECSLSQLSVVINPVKMFSYYTYRSSINAPYIKHCREMAIDMKERYGINENSFHIDLASNDGTLLKEFRDELGLKVMGVDPAQNLVEIARGNGIESRCDFWNNNLALEIYRNEGNADLITATNVFAHLDKVKDFLFACRTALNIHGVIVIENPYLIDFIENMEFDTIYFEHTQYWAVTPLKVLCEQLDLEIINAEKKDIHGGTMRYTIARKGSRHEVQPSVDFFSKQEVEMGYTSFDKYKNWTISVNELANNFKANIDSLKLEGKKVVAFGASAKGNTLLNYTQTTTDTIDYIIDETPEKIGKYSAGTGIPIYGLDILKTDTPDYIVILAWNFKEVIIKKLIDFGYEGKFIIPIPKFEIIHQ